MDVVTTTAGRELDDAADAVLDRAEAYLRVPAVVGAEAVFLRHTDRHGLISTDDGRCAYAAHVVRARHGEPNHPTRTAGTRPGLRSRSGLDVGRVIGLDRSGHHRSLPSV